MQGPTYGARIISSRKLIITRGIDVLHEIIYMLMLHNHTKKSHRLVVRTSRRGRDNPGSTPGVDMGIDDGVRETFARTGVALQTPLSCISRYTTSRFTLYVGITIVLPP